MLQVITHFIAFCLGAWACSAVLMPENKKEGTPSAKSQSSVPSVLDSREGLQSGGIEKLNQGEIVQQLGAVTKQVLTDENIKQAQSVAGQLLQQVPQMLSALQVPMGALITEGASPKPEGATARELELNKQLAAINQRLGVNGITEEEVRSLLEQERIAPDQKKLLEQYLEISRTLSEQIKK